jgi:uncharacterized protein YdeI (YjbR/CyaY-like superfamily)
VTPSGVRYFASPAAFGRWLERHHAKKTELWVGYHKKKTRRSSLTWSESVDEALCWGWIDGIRKSVDGTRYTNRFTPRRIGSIWSAINIRKAEALIAAGRMRPPGLAAFRARLGHRSRVYSFEQGKTAKLPRVYERVFRRNRAAWEFFRTRSDSYRRLTSWWVISAKQEETRHRRLDILIERSEARLPIPGLPRAPQALSSRSAK